MKQNPNITPDIVTYSTLIKVSEFIIYYIYIYRYIDIYIYIYIYIYIDI